MGKTSLLRIRAAAGFRMEKLAACSPDGRLS